MSPRWIRSNRSRRWKSGSAPAIFTVTSQIVEASPAFGFQWNLTKVLFPSFEMKRKVWMPNPSMLAKVRGSVRSDIAHITMWVVSGIKLMKSQNVSCAVAAWG